jgi:glycosyltransferase involved in cell wall biosynthesis
MQVWHLNLTRAELRVDGIPAAVRRLAAAQTDAGADVKVFSRVNLQTLVGIHDGLAGARSRPDVVHFHSVFRPFHAVVAKRLIRADVPYVVSPHSGYAPESLARRGGLKRVGARLVERRFVERAAAASCLTEVELDDLVYFSPRFRGQTLVAPNPLDGSGGVPPWRPAPGRPTSVTLARYDVRQKGLDRLAEVARNCPEVDFVVYGEQDKNERALTDRVRRAAPPNFSLRPPVFGPDKERVLAGATMFALLSRWEGLSMSLAEALATGVPCAVSRYVGRTLQGFGDGVGLVVDDDPAVAADQIRSALEDPGRLEAWSSAGAAYAATRFSRAQIAEQTLQLYRAVSSSRREPVAASA